jgi:hypothetical protein
MTKTEEHADVIRATTEFLRTWGFEPPPKADQTALELLLSANASKRTPPPKARKPTRHRRSAVPRSSDSYLSVREVASVLNVSTDTVIRNFAGLPGVVAFSRPSTRRKRRYRTLRISPEALKQFLRSKAGRGK